MKQHPPLACFAGLCFALAACCNAATVTWTGGGGDGQWGNPENWSTGALPAEADSVSFPVDATLPDGRVKLGADRRVARLTFTGQNNATILDGEGQWTLYVNGTGASGGSNTTRPVIDADVVIESDVTWTSSSSYSSNLQQTRLFTDKGAGWNVVASGSHNNNVTFLGTIDLAGSITTKVLNFRLGGVAYTNAAGEAVLGGRIAAAADVILQCEMAYAPGSDASLVLDNRVSVLEDRIADGVPVSTAGSGGSLQLTGNAATSVTERVSPVRLRSGKLTLRSTGKTSSQPTDLVVGLAEREPGTAMLFTTGTGGRVFVEGPAEANGILPAWLVASSCSFSKRNADTGHLAALATADYTAFEDGAAGATSNARITTGSVVTETPQHVWTLTFKPSSSSELVLGDDLTLLGGGLTHLSSQAVTIRSTGGALRFAGEDIVLAMGGTRGTLDIAAPLAWDGDAAGTPPNLVLPKIKGEGGLIFSGENRVERFNRLYVDSAESNQKRPICFRGDTTWCFEGPVAGIAALNLDGPGTLIFKGESQFRDITFNVSSGRVVLANAKAPRPQLSGAGTAVVPEGVVYANGVAYTDGGTLCGLGTSTQTLTLSNRGNVAGGTPEEPGTLTLSGGVRMQSGAGFGLTLGAETNSLILVSHSLTYPSSASTIVTNRIQVRDASHQSARIRDAVLPVLQYTGSLNDYRAENTVFVVENLSPLSLDISEAEAGLDAATKTVWVSGLKYVPQGVILTIR